MTQSRQKGWITILLFCLLCSFSLPCIAAESKKSAPKRSTTKRPAIPENFLLTDEGVRYPVRSFPRLGFLLMRKGMEVNLVKNKVEEIPLGVLGYGDLDEEYIKAGGADVIVYDLNYDKKPEFLLKGPPDEGGNVYSAATHLGDHFAIESVFEDEVDELINPQFNYAKRTLSTQDRRHINLPYTKHYSFKKGFYRLVSISLELANASIPLKVQKVEQSAGGRAYYLAEHLPRLGATCIAGAKFMGAEATDIEALKVDCDVTIQRIAFRADDGVSLFVATPSGAISGWVEAKFIQNLHLQ